MTGSTNASMCEACDRPTGPGRACQFCGQVIGADEGVQLAGIGQRLAAYSVDVAVVAGIVVVAMMTLREPLTSTFASVGLSAGTRSANLTPVMILVGVYTLATLVLMANGQTLGKAAVGIRVGKYDGTRAGFGRTVLREVIAKPLMSLVTALIGTLWALWDRDRQALYDKVAATIVIDDRDASGAQEDDITDAAVETARPRAWSIPRIDEGAAPMTVLSSIDDAIADLWRECAIDSDEADLLAQRDEIESDPAAWERAVAYLQSVTARFRSAHPGLRGPAEHLADSTNAVADYVRVLARLVPTSDERLVAKDLDVAEDRFGDSYKRFTRAIWTLDSRFEPALAVERTSAEA